VADGDVRDRMHKKKHKRPAKSRLTERGDKKGQDGRKGERMGKTGLLGNFLKHLQSMGGKKPNKGCDRSLLKSKQRKDSNFSTKA